MKKSIIGVVILLLIIIITCIVVFTKNNTSPNNYKKDVSTETNKIDTTDVEVEISNIYDTNIPDPKSVLGYKEPFMSSDAWNDSKYYMAIYSPYDADKDFYSKVNNPSDYEKYSKLLIENGFELKNTEKDGNDTIYTYSDETYTITLTINKTTFHIIIEKNN